MVQSGNKTNKPVLDKYKDALQPMVDEALAVQTLAPAMREAIEQNKPLNETIQGVATEAIERNPGTQKALEEWYNNSKAIRTSKSELRKPSYWIPIVLTSLIGIASVVMSIISLISSLSRP
ncbi:MAG: hypothetical protein NC548_27305 [Lachnospiraceae bacterium]|nr:hypothetical protein [Lachnospiraceae bacterium]